MDDLEKLREIPISRILGIQDKPRRYSIKCPFHADKTPSMVIYPDGSWHCYGCGLGGQNSIDFMIAGGDTFIEAVNELRTLL